MINFPFEEESEWLTDGHVYVPPDPDDDPDDDAAVLDFEGLRKEAS